MFILPTLKCYYFHIIGSDLVNLMMPGKVCLSAFIVDRTTTINNKTAKTKQNKETKEYGNEFKIISIVFL